MIVPVSLYQEWFHDHMDNPYPEMVDISELSVRTGLTIVSPRFANLSPPVININDPVPYDNSLIFSGSSLKLVPDCTSAFGYDRPCLTHVINWLRQALFAYFKKGEDIKDSD
jgi:hypothetical protein